MRSIFFALAIIIAICGPPRTGSGAQKEQRIATRVDDVTVQIKHHKLVVHVTGMGTTPTWHAVRGQLVGRNPEQPNKEGLLEYDLMFNPPASYSGFKLRQVKASLKESSVAPQVKGVRVYAEFNRMDATIPAAQEKKKRGFHLFGSRKEKILE